MARTEGPLMSLAASGSVAKTLTFSRWKGRPYVRQLVTPANPKSYGQYYTRAMIAFLSQVWRDLPDITQSAWTELASQGNFSPFNAFVKFNMHRWTQAQGPTTLPDLSGGTTPDTYGALTVTGGVRQIVVTQVLTVHANSWAFGLSLSDPGDTNDDIAHMRLIIPTFTLSSLDTITAIMRNVPTGNYSVNTYDMTEDGGGPTVKTNTDDVMVT